MQKVFGYLLATFAASQLIALALGAAFVGQQLSIVENPEDAGNAVTLMLYVLFSALVILLILKYYSGTLLFLAVEFFLILFSTQIVASLFLPFLAAMAVAIAVTAARFAFPALRQHFILYSTSVAGSLLGASLGIVPAVAFAVLLAAYDVVAVFYTKHMITLAKGLSDRGLAFSIQISARGKNPRAAAKKKIAGKAVAGTGPIESIELGTGDLVIPAMLMVSALKLSVVHAVAALLGSMVGLLGLLWLMEKRRGYFPALPPIVLGSLLFLGAATTYLFLLGK